MAPLVDVSVYETILVDVGSTRGTHPATTGRSAPRWPRRGGPCWEGWRRPTRDSGRASRPCRGGGRTGGWLGVLKSRTIFYSLATPCSFNPLKLPDNLHSTNKKPTLLEVHESK